jgi:hypothetical protein
MRDQLADRAANLRLFFMTPCKCCGDLEGSCYCSPCPLCDRCMKHKCNCPEAA